MFLWSYKFFGESFYVSVYTCEKVRKEEEKREEGRKNKIRMEKGK